MSKLNSPGLQKKVNFVFMEKCSDKARHYLCLRTIRTSSIITEAEASSALDTMGDKKTHRTWRFTKRAGHSF